MPIRKRGMRGSRYFDLPSPEYEHNPIEDIDKTLYENDQEHVDMSDLPPKDQGLRILMCQHGKNLEQASVLNSATMVNTLLELDVYNTFGVSSAGQLKNKLLRYTKSINGYNIKAILTAITSENYINDDDEEGGDNYNSPLSDDRKKAMGVMANTQPYTKEQIESIDDD